MTRLSSRLNLRHLAGATTLLIVGSFVVTTVATEDENIHLPVPVAPEPDDAAATDTAPFTIVAEPEPTSEPTSPPVAKRPPAAKPKAQAAKPKAPAAKDKGKPATKPEKADEPPSCHDGSRCGLVPVCYRVPLTKKKKHTEYDTKCELVCVPGCGCFHGHHKDCSSCTDGCGHDGCENVDIRKKMLLLKKVTEKEQESYEYKIKWVCPSCAGMTSGSCTGYSCTGTPLAPMEHHERSFLDAILGGPRLLR